MIRKAYLNDIEILNQLISEIDSKVINHYDLTEDPFTEYIVYCEDNTIMGFLSYAIMYDRSEINYILVSYEYRNQGVASKLMDYMITDCIKNNCINITLEVKASNNNAISLYHKYGFKNIAIRKKYYGNCDGIMMERMLVNK